MRYRATRANGSNSLSEVTLSACRRMPTGAAMWKYCTTRWITVTRCLKVCIRRQKKRMCYDGTLYVSFFFCKAGASPKPDSPNALRWSGATADRNNVAFSTAILLLGRKKSRAAAREYSDSCALDRPFSLRLRGGQAYHIIPPRSWRIFHVYFVYACQPR